MSTQSFDEYWRSYAMGHSKLSTRLVHYFGLIFGPLIGIFCSFFFVWWAFFVVYPICYITALITHPLFESNTNKEFANRPLWSVIALFRMLWLDITGRFSKHLQHLL